MPIDGFVPGRFFQPFALATILAVMFHLGMQVSVAQLRAAWRDPSLMLRGIFCSVVAVPVAVIVVARAFEIPRYAEIGMVLMAICPGAPLALRRALGAGGDATFALTLQVSLAILAVVTVPLSIAALDEVYAGSASVSPAHLARQVLVGQLLPLGLGMAARERFAAKAVRFERLLVVLSTTMLAGLLALAAVDVWEPVAGTRPRVALAIVVATSCAVGLGHWLGGPASNTRTALAVACAARNTGLALMVALLNRAEPLVVASVLAYVVISALTATPYVWWRSRGYSASRLGSPPV
ncbi:MAG TPA: bile acid:sodium symporter [Usitatibacter sp.]|nr:bile acid:sodium symporter [Usitatibacter sp.]